MVKCLHWFRGTAVKQKSLFSCCASHVKCFNLPAAFLLIVWKSRNTPPLLHWKTPRKNCRVTILKSPSGLLEMEPVLFSSFSRCRLLISMWCFVLFFFSFFFHGCSVPLAGMMSSSGAAAFPSPVESVCGAPKWLTLMSPRRSQDGQRFGPWIKSFPSSFGTEDFNYLLLYVSPSFFTPFFPLFLSLHFAIF